MVSFDFLLCPSLLRNETSGDYQDIRNSSRKHTKEKKGKFKPSFRGASVLLKEPPGDYLDIKETRTRTNNLATVRKDLKVDDTLLKLTCNITLDK